MLCRGNAGESAASGGVRRWEKKNTRVGSNAGGRKGNQECGARLSGCAPRAGVSRTLLREPAGQGPLGLLRKTGKAALTSRVFARWSRRDPDKLGPVLLRAIGPTASPPRPARSPEPLL